MGLLSFCFLRAGRPRAAKAVFFASALLLFSPIASRADDRTMNVLYITTLEGSSPAVRLVLESLRTAFAEAECRVDLFLESINGFRIPFTAKRQELLQDVLAERYRDIRLDAVIAQSSLAVAAAVRYRDSKAPEVPVYCFDMLDAGTTARFSAMKNVFGRVLSPPFEPTLRLAARLFPKTKKALFFFTAISPAHAKAYEAFVDSKRKEYPGMELVAVINADLPAVEAALRNAGGDSLVFLFPGGWNLPDGTFLYGAEIVKRLSLSFHGPFFGMIDTVFGSGLVGGSFIDYAAMGREAGETVLAILSGKEKPGPWLTSNAVTDTLDYRALKRFSVPSSRVPPEAKILFAPPEFWIRYKTELQFGIAGLVLTVAALAVFLAVRRKEALLLKEMNERLEKTVAERTEDLRSANAELETSNAKLVRSLVRIEGMHERLIAETQDAVIGRIALAFAHEINNPLAAIRASAYSMGNILLGGRNEGGLPLLLSKLDAVHSALFFTLLDFLRGRGKVQEERKPSAGSREIGKRLKSLGLDAAPGLADLLFDSGLSDLPDEALEKAAAPDNRIVLEGIYRAKVLENSIMITKEAVGRIADRVETLRSYARCSEPGGESPSASLEATLEQALLLFHEAVRKDITVVRRFEEGLPPVAAAEAGLVRLWTNLIQNAIQAMEGKGEIELRSKRDGAFAVTDVIDSGPGVDPAVRDKLFSPFAAAKNMDRGMGLGLSICKRIAEGAGGSISYGEAEGRTRFSVRLPLSEERHGD